MRKNFPVLAILLLATVAAGIAILGGLPSPAPAQASVLAHIITETPDPTHTPAPATATARPTNTSLPWPTSTPRPTNTPGGPTSTPAPTDDPGDPTATPLPPDFEIVDVAAPVPPDPAPAPWVGVVDFLVENLYVNDVWQGVWVVNTNPSLYENRAVRMEQVQANPAAQGDRCPDSPADDVHITRPQCQVNGEWWYVAGAWYYNGTSDVAVDPDWYDEELFHYGHPEYPEEFDVLVRYHHAYVPEPACTGACAWNFGADYTCDQMPGGGGGGGETPTPTPPPPPPSPTPVPECPSCSMSVSPYGTLDSPYLTPREGLTLTWSCAYPPEAELAGYAVRVWAYDGSSWAIIATHDISPDAPRQLVLDVVPGLLYRAQVTARFDVGGAAQSCCSGDTYYRYSMVVPPDPGSPEARLDYYSDHDSDPSHGPDNPYRTTGSAMLWNYGEFLHAHPSAEWTYEVHPGWQARTDIRQWKYRGSKIGDTWYAATCTPPAARSCDWQEERPGILAYLHLRWYKHLQAGETANLAAGDGLTWVYVTDPLTVSIAYDVQAETTWRNEQTGFEVTWPAFTQTLTVTVDLQYATTYRYGWPR